MPFQCYLRILRWNPEVLAFCESKKTSLSRDRGVNASGFETNLNFPEKNTRTASERLGELSVEDLSSEVSILELQEAATGLLMLRP